MVGRGDEASLRADVPAVVRHGRACPGPTFLVPRASAWIPGTRPGMTVLRSGASLTECGVRILREGGTPVSKRRHGRARRRASLRADVPAIHVLWCREQGRGCPTQGRE